MKFPPFKKRTRRELKQALLWAQRELSLENWDIDLVLDGEVALHPLFEDHRPGSALVARNTNELRAVVGVVRSICERGNEDPLKALFHEAGHVALWWHMLVDSQDAADVLWEQTANRFALLLWKLYPHK